jgi:hypothetical protein
VDRFKEKGLDAAGSRTHDIKTQPNIYLPKNLSDIKIRASGNSRQIKGHRGSNLSEIQIKHSNGIAVSNF